MDIGGRTLAKILKTFNEVFDGMLGEIPCANTIDSWTLKCGLDSYKNAAKQLEGRKYAEIIDESMMIGSCKLALTLGVPAEHQGHALSHEDTVVLGIETAKSFNAERITIALKNASKRAGHDPEYVISDNASVMKRGIMDAGYHHHLDVSHSLGMFMERVYKRAADFTEYTTCLADINAKHNMRPIAYILPPQQRSKARFINMSTWVNWSKQIIDVYSNLTEEEKEITKFVPANASLIDELDEVLSCVSYIEDVCKTKGLSVETSKLCIRHIKNTIMKGNERMRLLASWFTEYLQSEVSWIGKHKHNVSSDIIESTFGIYKQRTSPNNLYGVTALVLVLPLIDKLAATSPTTLFKIRSGVENYKVKDIKEWGETNLPKNLVVKRHKKLKRAI